MTVSVNARYRLVKETLAIVQKDGKADLVTLQVGSVLTVKKPPSTETGRILVEWEDKTLELFIIDLEDRGQLEYVQDGLQDKET